MANLEDIRYALDLARQGGFNEVELEVEGVEFSARLDAIPVASDMGASDHLDDEPTAPAENYADVVATCVGYFQPAKSPVAVGDAITKGQVVAGITALGLANDVESKVTGVVAETLVAPGQAVQYGQPIFRVKL